MKNLPLKGNNIQWPLVFGRERTGLTNDELQSCHYHVCIPANPEYSSLNLAMAVQTLAYEVRVAYLNRSRLTILSKKKSTHVTKS